jgi:hypothetical protein
MRRARTLAAVASAISVEQSDLLKMGRPIFSGPSGNKKRARD